MLQARLDPPISLERLPCCSVAQCIRCISDPTFNSPTRVVSLLQCCAPPLASKLRLGIDF